MLDLSLDSAALTARLVDIPSVSGSEGDLADAIAHTLGALGHLNVERDGNAVVARTELGRAERVVLEALDREGRPFRLEAGGLTARAIQHEIDHLDGILFLDHLGLMKRRVLLARWKREHKDDTSYLKEVQPATARPE